MLVEFAIQLAVAQVVVVLDCTVGVRLAIAGVGARQAGTSRAQIALGARIAIGVASLTFMERHQLARPRCGFADVMPTKIVVNCRADHDRGRIERALIGLEIAVQIAIANVAIFKFGAILVGLALANVDAGFANAGFAMIAACAAVAIGIAWQILLYRRDFATAGNRIAQVLATRAVQRRRAHDDGRRIERATGGLAGLVAIKCAIAGVAVVKFGAVGVLAAGTSIGAAYAFARSAHVARCAQVAVIARLAFVLRHVAASGADRQAHSVLDVLAQLALTKTVFVAGACHHRRRIYFAFCGLHIAVQRAIAEIAVFGGRAIRVFGAVARIGAAGLAGAAAA